MKTAEMFCRLPPLHPYIAHPGGGRSSPQRGNKLLKGNPLPLGQDLDISTAVVARISTQAKRQSCFDDEVAEADSLHPSTHPGMQFLDVVTFMLAHAHYDSISCVLALQ